jgi:phasin family protein
MLHCSNGCTGRQAKTQKATTMNKTNSTADKATSAATTEIYAGAEILKSGFEKTAKIFETAAEFSKGNAEAYIESATIAGEGFRTISSEISLYTKKSIEESVAATKAIMGSKSMHEAMEHQTGFAKMAFSAYLGHLKLLNELFTENMKDTLAPLKVRFEAFSEITQSAAVA